MPLLDHIMEQPLIYRLWQAPFANRKLAPVLARPDFANAKRVLDVACGPGTNAAFFADADYLGVDVNPRYIETARARYRGRFVAAEAISWSSEATELFDFILVNSFLHHLTDHDVRTLMQSLPARLTPAGKLHIVDIVMPDSPGVARTLARHDRGHYVRPAEELKKLLSESMQIDWFESYQLLAFGIPCWHVVYAVGSRR